MDVKMKGRAILMICILVIEEPKPIPKDPRDHRPSWCQNIPNEFERNCFCAGMSENDACHQPQPESAICTTVCKMKSCRCRKRCET